MSEGNLKGNFGRVLKDGGTRRLALFVGAVLVVAGYFVFIKEPPSEEASSRLVRVPASQGGEAAPDSAARADLIRRGDQQRIDAARQQGGSAIPSIPGNRTEQAPIILEDGPAAPAPPSSAVERPQVAVDPLPPRPRVVANEAPPRPSPVVQPARVGNLAPADGRQDARAERIPSDQALVNAYQNQMTSIISRTQGAPPAVVQVYQQDVADRLADRQRQQAERALMASSPVPAVAEASAPSSAREQPGSRIKVPLPGTVLYAEMVSRANSDAPGPVLARVLQGPYTGATLIGSFDAAESALVIRFNQMTVEKDRDGNEIGETVPIEAVAVDTKYIGTALATSVDRHLWSKLSTAFLSSFVQGYGQAIGEAGTTTIDRGDGTLITQNPSRTTKDNLFVAGGRAFGAAGQILQREFGNRPTTIIVETGTPIGLLFLGR
jgi:intracellular multiplication protein IcmE